MKKRIKKIESILQDFKGKADEIEKSFAFEKSERDRFAKNPDGRYSEDYIATFLREWKPAKDYSKMLVTLKEQTEEGLTRELSQIRGHVDKVLTTNPDPGFATKISAFYQLGMQNSMSHAEFEALKRQAKTYSELAMLSQLAASRTKNNTQISLDASGNPTTHAKTVNDGFEIRIPDPAKIYSSLSAFEDKVKSVVKWYVPSGDPDLQVDKSVVGISMRAQADRYYLRGFDSQLTLFAENIAELDGLLNPEKTLTQEQLELLAFLTDFDKYPMLAKDRAVEIAERSENLREMFRKDVRFAEAINDRFPEDKE